MLTHPSAIAASPFRKWFLFMAEIGMLHRSQFAVKFTVGKKGGSYLLKRREGGDLINQELCVVLESRLASRLSYITSKSECPYGARTV